MTVSDNWSVTSRFEDGDAEIVKSKAIRLAFPYHPLKYREGQNINGLSSNDYSEEFRAWATYHC